MERIAQRLNVGRESGLFSRAKQKGLVPWMRFAADDPSKLGFEAMALRPTQTRIGVEGLASCDSSIESLRFSPGPELCALIFANRDA